MRIAEQVLAVAPAAEVVDIGAFAHGPRGRWKRDSVSVIGLTAALGGPAGELAGACLQRGYTVEQELAVVEAIEQTLDALMQRRDRRLDREFSSPAHSTARSTGLRMCDREFS